MKRLAESTLLSWYKKTNRKPLLIDGARQVGKTYLVEKLFGPKNVNKLIKLNFMKEPSLADIFQSNLSPELLVKNIQLVTGDEFNPKTDLLFFDEIGLCQGALNSLKFFNEERPDIAIIATGSNIGLLGSFPVGQVDRYQLHPMGFEEFLWANGFTALADEINSADRQTISPAVHERIWQLLLDYYFVGGMPSAVSIWASSNKDDKILKTVTAVRDVHKSLIQDYKNDFGKFSSGTNYNALHIARVFESVPVQLMKAQDGNAPKYRFKDVVKGVRSYAPLESPIEFLEKVRLVKKSYVIEGRPSSPLKIGRANNRFKLLLHDVGLLNAMLDISYREILQQSQHYKGYIAENFVANELFLAGASEGIDSWASKRNAKLEFLVTDSHGNIIPIEVKSGKSVKSKSMSEYVKAYRPNHAYKLTGRLSSASKEGPIKELPLYMTAPLYRRLMKE